MAAGIDQAWVTRRDGFGIEPKALQRSRPQVGEEHVCRTEQVVEHLQAPRAADVERE